MRGPWWERSGRELAQPKARSRQVRSNEALCHLGVAYHRGDGIGELERTRKRVPNITNRRQCEEMFVAGTILD